MIAILIFSAIFGTGWFIGRRLTQTGAIVAILVCLAGMLAVAQWPTIEIWGAMRGLAFVLLAALATGLIYGGAWDQFCYEARDLGRLLFKQPTGKDLPKVWQALIVANAAETSAAHCGGCDNGPCLWAECIKGRGKA